MSLNPPNPQYIPLYQLQQYFVDKVTRAPLAGGRVYFYSDVNRTDPKTVYELSSTTGSYTFVPLPNPIVLSSVGTPVDNDGNDIVIYAFPFDAVTGESELYYVVVQDALGRPQFTREAVPGTSGSGVPSETSALFNYIPNGQFLAHTNLPSATNTLVAGSNIIAQGGFSIELPDILSSTNTLTFQELGFTENPENSPRFLAEFTCVTPSAMDAFKIFRIKFNDVNKFSATNDFYTFAFWGEGNVSIPISIQIFKFFGTTGSILPPETIFTDTITTEGDIHQYQFQFGTNEGEIVDTVNNNDFVAIDIAFPTDIGFEAQLTNFVLVLGQQVLTGFPIQTNADMITRGVDGWTDVPNYGGGDLYLPKTLTRYGYQYDEDEVGDIGATIKNIVSPLSVSPLPKSNKMLLDGATYIYADYSAIGIPFSRLGDVLLGLGPFGVTPLFGTGANYATAYANDSGSPSGEIFRLTVNSDGAGIPYAIDGGTPTGFTFTGIPTYNGSTTGHVSLNYFAFKTGVAGNQLICKSNFQAIYPDNPNNYVIDGDIPTGFTFAPIIYDTGIYAQQSIAFTIDTLPAASLIQGLGNPAQSYYFFTAPDQLNPYYVWFNVTGEVDPGPPIAQPGALPIEVKVNTTDTNGDIANTLTEVMNALQSTNIDITVVPPAGSYFFFSANPASIRNFYVWYEVDGLGTDPLIAGRIGIKVSITSSLSHHDIRHFTILAINQYQYAVPNAQGMFLRNADPTGLFDFDNLTRWSTVTGLTGPAVGTFEYSQFFGHYHLEFKEGNVNNRGLDLPTVGPDIYPASQFTDGTSYDTIIGGNNIVPDEGISGISGGSETRPVNMYVNYFIYY